MLATSGKERDAKSEFVRGEEMYRSQHVERRKTCDKNTASLLSNGQDTDGFVILQVIIPETRNETRMHGVTRRVHSGSHTAIVTAHAGPQVFFQFLRGYKIRV